MCPKCNDQIIELEFFFRGYPMVGINKKIYQLKDIEDMRIYNKESLTKDLLRPTIKLKKN